MTDSILHPDLVALARRVVDENRRMGRTIALAESCTGGLVSAAITEIPGSSEVFEASFITYSNEIKQELLKVSQDVLETFGSVSIATAWAMAQGALARSHAHVAVAITGIAGPGGGLPGKPSGTVHFHLSAADGYERRECIVWTSDRSGNKLLSAQMAIGMVVDYLEQKTR